jgi:hypothetical protein
MSNKASKPSGSLPNAVYSARGRARRIEAGGEPIGGTLSPQAGEALRALVSSGTYPSKLAAIEGAVIREAARVQRRAAASPAEKSAAASDAQHIPEKIRAAMASADLAASLKKAASVDLLKIDIATSAESPATGEITRRIREAAATHKVADHFMRDGPASQVPPPLKRRKA